MSIVIELETWFKKADLPQAPLELFPGTIITDMQLFLNSHFIPLRNDPAGAKNEAHLYRLKALKAIIERKNKDV
ncbi:DUF6965 family protein [Sphingobacterium siyangense]|uniref:DUF6965 family protein n=1 Tax=Sphingobacterium siyangense TaxID=459529 RepID=UPI0019655C76|nr:hypothetical protein [Sphingobacterium siyangense]QRY55522.1 hypothetical protein JVX97_15895 [Sphingobacterium siyangense]